MLCNFCANITETCIPWQNPINKQYNCMPVCQHVIAQICVNLCGLRGKSVSFSPASIKYYPLSKARNTKLPWQGYKFVRDASEGLRLSWTGVSSNICRWWKVICDFDNKKEAPLNFIFFPWYILSNAMFLKYLYTNYWLVSNCIVCRQKHVL